MKLKKCPCGKIPEYIGITDSGQGGKWAGASGSCCGAWEIEFRTQYFPPSSKEIMELAVEAWNEAPRWDDETI